MKIILGRLALRWIRDIAFLTDVKEEGAFGPLFWRCGGVPKNDLCEADLAETEIKE